MTMYTPIDQIPTMEVEHLLTGFSNLDRMFGEGPPLGAVSLLAGEGGTGKSRLSLEIASFVNRDEMKVLYFQLEMALPMFKKYLNGKKIDSTRFAVSELTAHDKMIEAIRDYRPNLVVIDSVNMIEDAHNTFVVREMMKKFLKTAQELNCHIMMIGQLGKDKKVKGSTDWVYLPDIICHLRRVDIDKNMVKNLFDNVDKKYKRSASEKKIEWLANMDKELKRRFIVSIPNKNRFGPVGNAVTMKHFDEDIKQVGGQSTFDESFTGGVEYPSITFSDKITQKELQESFDYCNDVTNKYEYKNPVGLMDRFVAMCKGLRV